jgi:hypothetical protein
VSSLSVQVLPQTNVDPLPPKTLADSRQLNISIPPSSRNLSYQKFPTTKIVPGIQNDDEYLFSSYINVGSQLLSAAFAMKNTPSSQQILYGFTFKLNMDMKCTND